LHFRAQSLNLKQTSSHGTINPGRRLVLAETTVLPLLLPFLVSSAINLLEARSSYGDAAPQIAIRGIYA